MNDKDKMAVVTGGAQGEGRCLRFKFNTVGLFTRDNKATVDFYTKTFGFTTDWDGIQPTWR